MWSMSEAANADGERVRLDILKRMSPAQKIALMTELTLAVQQLAFAGARRADPAASDDEIWLRLATRRLGRNTVRKIYGFDAEPK